MSVQILEGREGNAVFFCSTTDWAFGPLFPDAEAAIAFQRSLNGTDPRIMEDAELERKWNEFRLRCLTGCPFGHEGKIDISNHRDRTVFSCFAKGCKAAWDLNGNVLDEEVEDED